MAEAAFLSPTVYLALITAFAVPVVSAIVAYTKRQGAIDTKSASADTLVGALTVEMTELKTEGKELRREIQNLISAISNIEALRERTARLETRIDKDLIGVARFEDALTFVRNLAGKISSLEERMNRYHNGRQEGSGR